MRQDSKSQCANESSGKNNRKTVKATARTLKRISITTQKMTSSDDIELDEFIGGETLD
jgi:hypothetical protein